MYATVKDLRLRSRELLAATQRGETVEITHRGKPCARLVGLDADDKKNRPTRNPAFGLWADPDEITEERDIDAKVCRLRDPRTFETSS